MGVPLLLAATLVLAGCASLPDSGPVQVAQGPGSTPSTAPFDFAPPGPASGASPEETVAGFLGALQAAPASTEVANRFLTSTAAEDWHPERRTVVYANQETSEHGDRVSVTLDDAFALDRNGRWSGALPAADRLQFRVVRDHGEWRIADLPDATVIPEAHFVTRYREYALYFFDATGEVLVPDPVYLPSGAQAPTQLVAGLLAGPSGPGAAVQRSYFPRGTRLGVSVPVGPDRTAEVPLSDEMRGVDETTLRHVVAQLAWTLQQVEGISRIRISADGAPVELSDGGSAIPVAGWREFSPIVAQASSQLFGLRGRRVVEVDTGSEVTVATLRGSGLQGRPRSLGVSLTGAHYAVVSGDGDHVSVLDRSPSDRPQPAATYAGHDLLRPMWDRTDRLWLVDDATTAAAVRVLHGRRVTTLRAPGVTGGRVVAAAISRDGTRLAVVLRRPTGPRLVVLGVVRGQGGEPVRLTRARTVATTRPLTGVRGLGWSDPTTLAVLARPSATTSEIVHATVDGSSGHIALNPPPDVLFDAGTHLAASPGDPASIVVLTRPGPLYSLGASGRWGVEAVASGLGAPAFVG